MKKKLVGKLRLTIVMEWSVEELAHYQAKNIQECADSVQQQLDEGELKFEDAITWGDVILSKVEVADL